MYSNLNSVNHTYYEQNIKHQAQQINIQVNNALQWFNHLYADRKRKICAASELVLSMDDKRNYSDKKYWVSPVCKLRKTHGFYHAVMPAVRLENLGYENYFRMSATDMENLLQKVGPLIKKEYVLREPIEPGERLAATLRFLASGDSVHSMHYQYLFGTTTADNIISETCAAIWDALQPEVLPNTLDQNEWLEIANDFEEKWDFPHCVGAIDGKHVNIQCPPNAGSMYCNYKHFHSIVLLAICDANYVFRFVDIGAYGRRSDGGIFANSEMGRKFESGKMNLPSPSSISDARPTPLPYCIVGDEAFPLKSYLLRPYPGKDSASLPKRVFNFRLSRARKIIENTFGILASIWRIFRHSIIATEKNAIGYVKAAVCLHNWLRLNKLNRNSNYSCIDNQIEQAQQTRSNETAPVPGAFRDITRSGPNNYTYRAEQIREEYCSYFNNEGALDWQYNYI